MRKTIVDGRRMSVCGLLGVSLVLMAGVLVTAAAETRFPGLFLDVRAAAQESLAAAEALTEQRVEGFGQRYQDALGPIKDRLRATLADADVTDRQVRDVSVELDIASDRFREAMELEATLRRAMETARRASEELTDGFGRRYQQELAPVVDVPRELLDDGGATIDDARQMSSQLTEALADYERVQELIASANHSLYLAERVSEYAGELEELDDEPLPPLVVAVESALADGEATISQVAQVSEQLNDALHAVGDPLEERFTAAVNIDSRAFPAGTDPESFALVDEFPLPQEGWRFRKDRPRLGYYENWHDPTLDDSDWRPILIEEFWNAFMTERYIGVAWYRATIDVPEFADYDALGLLFRGVDENGWVWVNGRYVGQQNIGPQGWSRPFQLDVTDALRPGEPNQITVRVKNSAGSGGIWEPARVIAFERFAD